MLRKTVGPGLIAVLALLALRTGIGMHFFSEGLSKIRSGQFDASGFLESACGPMATTFQSMLNDPDGSRLLCVTAIQGTGNTAPVFKVDSELTRCVWDDFVDRCSSHYGFGDSTLEKSLTAARELLASHVDELEQWLAFNRVELIGHYSTAGRAHQFLRDESGGPQIAQDVESIRKQIDEVRLRRKTKVREWSGEVNAIWNSLELSINDLALNSQRNLSRVVLHRPHDQPGSAIHWINRIVPLFDLTVGVLLVLGLFPRLAALAAGLFLASVIATQPPWIPGATPTWYQSVEMLALFVFASGIASVVPGMGWLISGPKRQLQPSGSIAVPVTAGSQTT